MSISTNELRNALHQMPHVDLGFFPTPLQKLENLSEDLGVDLWMKRDDFTGSNLFGGNKTRKLEYLIGQAKARGCDYVFTYGATQSNHAMQTIWAAAKHGIKSIVYLAAVVKPDMEDLKANMLLDTIFGAEIHVVEMLDGESFEDAEYRSFKMGAEHIARLEAEGHKCLDIPMGGANVYGSLGYVQAMAELTEQLADPRRRQADSQRTDAPQQFDYLYHACGSGGTMAGIVAGKKLLGLDTEIHSITAMPVGDSYAKGSAALASETIKLLGFGSEYEVTAEELIIDQNHYGPGYECPSEEGTEAIKLLARREGILVDPVYSGKAFAGLLSDVRTGKIPAGSHVVFVHTGGATVFFAEKEIIGQF